MVISSITIFSWLIKPLIGYAVDKFFNKRVWIFLALALDIILVFIVGIFHLPLWILVGILVLNSNNAAFRDVAVDGIMCVEGKRYNATGKIQSIQWISISIAGLVTGVLGGYIAEVWDYRTAFLCLIPIYLLVAIPASICVECGLVVNRPHSTLFSDLKQLFANKRLLIVCLFIFLYKYSPSFGVPLSFMQRDAFKWSKVWIGWLGTISTVFSIIGSLLYYRFSQRINIRKWLYFSVFLGAVTTLSYLYYTPVSAIIYDIVYSLMGMFIFLMVMDFMARNTLKGMEATSFALLTSFSNLALVSSNLSGSFLLPIVGLKWLIVLSAFTSFLCLPLIARIDSG
jgi:MFS family permease